MGYNPWGRKESDTTEQLHFHFSLSGVAQSRTQLKQLSSSSGYYLEKDMASHSSTLAWKIPWMEGPGRLQSLGSLTVGHD